MVDINLQFNYRLCYINVLIKHIVNKIKYRNMYS